MTGKAGYGKANICYPENPVRWNCPGADLTKRRETCIDLIGERICGRGALKIGFVADHEDHCTSMNAMFRDLDVYKLLFVQRKLIEKPTLT